MPTGRVDPRLLLALAWLAGFTLIDSGIVSLALPDIAADFDKTVGELAWVSTGFLLALSATLLAAGRLNDRYGSRLVLASGAFAFLLLTAACAAAPTFELLIAARIGQGIAGGILYTVSLAIVVTAFPPERRAWAIGIYFTSGALGAVIGPVIGGLLTDLGGWRLVFWVQLPLPALVVIGAWLLLPARSGRAVSIDLPGLAAAATFMVAATFGALQLAVPGAEGVALVAAVVAIVALAAFVFIERRVAEPAVRLSIFGNPRFVTATAAGTATWFAIMSSVTFAALYLQLGRGLSPADAGLLILTGPLVGLVLFPFAGRFVGRIGVDAATLLGLAILSDRRDRDADLECHDADLARGRRADDQWPRASRPRSSPAPTTRWPNSAPPRPEPGRRSSTAFASSGPRWASPSPPSRSKHSPAGAGRRRRHCPAARRRSLSALS